MAKLGVKLRNLRNDTPLGLLFAWLTKEQETDLFNKGKRHKADFARFAEKVIRKLSVDIQ